MLGGLHHAYAGAARARMSFCRPSAPTEKATVMPNQSKSIPDGSQALPLHRGASALSRASVIDVLRRGTDVYWGEDVQHHVAAGGLVSAVRVLEPPVDGLDAGIQLHL